MKPLEDALLLPGGVPSLHAYRQALPTRLFATIEQYSARFLAQHEYLAKLYKWGKDPLHQWSRQWEYLYALQQITACLPRGGRARIFDAGSGITFFPFLLAQREPAWEIVCGDSDVALEPLYRRVEQASPSNGNVRFTPADLGRLSFEDGYFDLVYSVSVLEHTTDPIAIVDELCRVLKPGGTLVLTFDIGLDGVSWLAPEEAQGVLDHLARCFDRKRVDLRHDLGTSDVLTSDVVGKMDRNLVPWVSPFLSLVLTSVRRRKFPARPRKKLAFYCGTYSSPAGGVQTRHGD